MDLLFLLTSIIVAVQSQFPCESNIYCHGPLLDAVQRSGIYNDSKHFVDMKLLDSPENVSARFTELDNNHPNGIPKPALQQFVGDHFSEPEAEFEDWELPDWTQSPPELSKIKDTTFHVWANELNELWKKLARKIKKEVFDQPNRTSLLYVPNPFIIPGDRFREYYYWDSYWIIRGLLVCNMTTTAKGIIENFLHLVKELGHVPNGGRIYYTLRSQPPLLIQMVDAYYKATNDIEFLRTNLPILDEEHKFWMRSRTINVSLVDQVTVYQLAHYSVAVESPRPEGYMEDLRLTENMTTNQTTDLYSNIASACESGWDFSTRWLPFDGPGKLQLNSIKTRSILPVDLNSILYKNEVIMSQFYSIVNDIESKEQYNNFALQREKAITAVFWDHAEGVWLDYDMERNERRKAFYPSNIFPFFSGSLGLESNRTREYLVEQVIKYLKKENVLTYPGGIPTSGQLNVSNQWDFPNAWPPTVHLFIESLREMSTSETENLAFETAQTWLRSNHIAYAAYKKMFEKYDVREKGKYGGGGEYFVQEGFGWTNGVAFILLTDYADTVSAEIPTSNASYIALTYILLMLMLI